MNQALSGKWLWKLGDNSEGLWQRSLIAKYGIPREGCDIPESNSDHTSLWREITSIESDLESNICFQIGTGERIGFWQDLWIGDRPLAAQFLELYRCASNRQAKVINYLSRNANQIVWSSVFRWNFMQIELSQFYSLMELFNGLPIPENGTDHRVWARSSDGKFSVASFFLGLTKSHAFFLYCSQSVQNHSSF